MNRFAHSLSFGIHGTRFSAALLLLLFAVVALPSCVMRTPLPGPPPEFRFTPKPVLLTPAQKHEPPIVVVARRGVWGWMPVLTFSAYPSSPQFSLPGEPRPELLGISGGPVLGNDPEHISTPSIAASTARSPIGTVFRNGQLIFTFDGSKTDFHVSMWTIHYLIARKRNPHMLEAPTACKSSVFVGIKLGVQIPQPLGNVRQAGTSH